MQLELHLTNKLFLKTRTSQSAINVINVHFINIVGDLLVFILSVYPLRLLLAGIVAVALEP